MTKPIKWLALSTLMTLWIALLYVYVIDVPPPIEVQLKYQTGQTVEMSQQTHETETWEVKSLRAQARELAATPRINIFTGASIAHPSDPETIRRAQQKKRQKLNAVPSTVSVSPAPPPPTPEELARQQEALAAQAAQQREQLRRQQLQEHMTQYRYLGYVNQNGVQKAFLGKGHEIHILRQGDTLDGQFVVESIDAMTVTITESTSKLETILTLKKEGASPSGT